MNSKRCEDFFALIGGAILPLAFAPFHLYLIAVLSPAILFATWLSASPKRALWRGWLFGVGMFGIGVSWVYVSIHEFGNTAAPLAAFFTALFVMVLAIFPALQGFILKKYFPKNRMFEILLLFPVTWVLLEWIRSWLLTGFPWLLIGYSQVMSPLRGFIPLVGAYGVGFLILISSASLVLLFINWRSIYRWVFTFVLLVIIWGGGFLLAQIQWTKPLGRPLRVALIQGNIKQSMKWLPNQVVPTLKTYTHLTEDHWDSDLIIWPEAAIPIPFKFANNFLASLDLRAKQHKVALVTGIPVEVPDRFSFYNAMIVVGEGSGHYYKRRLVPFGEYVPFGGLLRGVIALLNIPMSDMESGPAKQPDLIVTLAKKNINADTHTNANTKTKTNEIKIAPFICYEIAYAGDLYSELPEGNLLVTISNDAWFGNSLAPDQHVEMGQFRAIQGGRAMLFNGNNGITAIINAKGEVIKRLPQFIRGALTGEVQPRSGTTPWIRYGGNWSVIIFFWLLLAGGFLFGRCKSKYNASKDNSKG